MLLHKGKNNNSENVFVKDYSIFFILYFEMQVHLFYLKKLRKLFNYTI